MRELLISMFYVLLRLAKHDVCYVLIERGSICSCDEEYDITSSSFFEV